MSPKEQLRSEIKKYLHAVPREEFCSRGEKAAALLRSSPLWRRYATVFLFLSMKSEIETHPLLGAALKEGKKVLAPGVEDNRLVFRHVASAEGPWRKGPFGIREPTGAEAGDGDFPALVLAPGLAFTREGTRLGRGGGYYDRFFAELDREKREYTALGFCMDFQIREEVPSAERDKKMDGFLTGTELVII